MNVLQAVKRELLRYGIETNKFETLSNKDGVLVVRLTELSYVLKMFFNKYSREIEIYNIFHRLGIKTARVIEFKESSILLEDIDKSDYYRFATKEDLKNPEVIEAITRWYQTLHNKGYDYFISNNTSLYSEIESINPDVIEEIIEKSGYNDSDFHKMILESLPLIKRYCFENRTFCYNDFDVKDLVVSKDLKDAFMIDYNFVGWGLPYFDYRNLLSSPDISSDFEGAIAKFLNISSADQLIDEVTSDIFTAHAGYQKLEFPNWSIESLDRIKSGEVKTSLVRLISEFYECSNANIISLVDEEIVLRNAVISDVDQLATWWASGELMEHAGFPDGIETDKEALKNKILINNVSGIKDLTLIIQYNNISIGEMGYRQVFRNVYEIGIKICIADYQNKGIGTRALNLLLDFLLNDLKARRIVLDTSIENVHAQKVYEDLGFVKTRVVENNWTDQIGNKRTTVHYELNVNDVINN